LFPSESRNEAPPADFATTLETAKNIEEIAPLGGVRFTREQVAEQDSITSEELAGERF
jgi:hypothetical protein